MGITIIGNANDSTPNSKFPSRCATPAFKNIPLISATVSRCGTPDNMFSVQRIQPKLFATPVPSHPSDSVPSLLTNFYQCDPESLRANVFWLFTTAAAPDHSYEYADDESALDDDDDDEEETDESSGSTTDSGSTPTMDTSTESGIPFPGADYSHLGPQLDQAELQRNLERIQALPTGTFTSTCCNGNCDCCNEDFMKVEKNKRRPSLIGNMTDKVTNAGKAILNSATNGVRSRKLSISGNRYRSKVFQSSPLAGRVISSTISATSDTRTLLGLSRDSRLEGLNEA